MGKKTFMFDIETYPNYSLFAFKSTDGELITFDAYGPESKLSKDDRKAIKKILLKNTIITFNGMNFDLPVTTLALKGANVRLIYRIANHIIKTGEPHWETYDAINSEPLPIDHVDLKEPSPAVMISLKLYGARLGSQELWDLPFPPGKKLKKKEANTLKEYCENDLDVTMDLYNGIKNRIELREKMSEQYGIDLRSKSDAQIAEAVIVSELEKEGERVWKPTLKKNVKLRYKAPKYIKFKTPQLQHLLKLVNSIEFGLQANGAVKLPPELTREKIDIGTTTYKIGIGGLHSQEKSLVVESNEKSLMKNADFASYYPAIILEQKLFPKHLGESFLGVYGKIREERLYAKQKVIALKKELLHVISQKG